MNLSEKITCDNFELEIHKDGYYLITINGSREFTIDDLKILVHAQKELGQHKIPSLVLCAEQAATNIELLNTLAKKAFNPYSTADAFLTKLNILPFEGATGGRQLYHEAKLMQAVAEIKKKQYKKALQFIAGATLWPINLGVGKPYQEDIDERLEDWLNYVCYTNLGNAAAASEALQKIIAFTPKVDNTVMNFLPANQLVSAWAIEKTASVEKATAWLQQQAALYPANKIIQWSLQAYTKQGTATLTADEKNGEVRILEQLYNHNSTIDLK